jgi:hypothetical protein
MRKKDQHPPIKLDLDRIWDPETGLSSFPQRQFDWILDHIEDPETGLAALAKRRAKVTQEQALSCLFWQIQFTQWRDYRAGDALAVWRAAASCALGKRPPPAWLCKAISECCWQGMPAAERRERVDLAKHQMHWEAVQLVLGRLKGHPLNYEEKVHPDEVFTEAAKLVADTDAKAGADMVKKSYQMIKRAGGMNATLQSYRREKARKPRGKNNLG